MNTNDKIPEEVVPFFPGDRQEAIRQSVEIVKKKINRQDISEGVAKAKLEREKFVKKNPEKSLSFDGEILKMKKALEDKKKLGKQTTQAEAKLKDLQTKLKPFKGKIKKEDAQGISMEIKNLMKEINGL